MKKTIFKSATALFLTAALSGCIAETFPQEGLATEGQASEAPGVFDNFVSACTSTLVGDFTFYSDGSQPWDFGYPTFFLMRDVMGQDIAIENSSSEWYSTWYQVGTGLGPEYLNCQAPWTYYYKWINNCNIVLRQAGENPSDEYKAGAGIAYAMRAMFYMDLARMFQYTYKGNEEAETVPIIDEKFDPSMATNNPRATNERIWGFIIDDLNKAEEYLEGYTRPNKETPDISVVYGLKARAYLTVEDFENAEKYAKMAQTGYSAMTEDQYLDHDLGFNTPNSSWMMYTQYDPSDPNITVNDGDSSWGSQMILEIYIPENPTSGCGYASNYGCPKRIDAHLFSTIPDTDFRKKCFVDPKLDEIIAEVEDTVEDDEATENVDEQYEAVVQAVKDYFATTGQTEYPESILYTANATTSGLCGCLSLKFRALGSHTNQYTAFSVSVPLMRVEEMMLIEAEAAGMQDAARGRQLLETFAKTRDPQYQYDESQTFRDNVWWQRRVELWGEGFATFDIKRLNKGIIRSYAGTNHPAGYRYNTDDVPYWMNLCIVQTETNFNLACTNNPTPIAPDGDSPEHKW